MSFRINGKLPLGSGMLPGPAKRIKRELADMNENPTLLCSAGPKGANLSEWMVTLMGPPGSPYQEGVFFLDMSFCPEYPFKPPKVMFKTRIYHCNVSASGQLHLGILKEGWSPALTIASILEAILALLREPKPNNALVGSIAQQYLTDRATHDRIAMEWTQRFAI